MTNKKETHNFGEKETENKLPVWKSPKYEESKKKAIEIIESQKYGLVDGDFWILMNKTKSGDKMAYTGLILSHNGCLKINDASENKVDPSKFIVDKQGYANSLVFTYIDNDTYEVGEFNSANGKNAYPYAMAFKRCFDRVVLKKSKLAYSGIYSEVEADEFKQQIEQPTEAQNKTNVATFSIDAEPVATKLTETGRQAYYDKIWKYESVGVQMEAVTKYFKVEDIQQLPDKELKQCLEMLQKKYGEIK